MSPLTAGNPNTIHLGGPATPIHDKVAIEAITPGHLLEYHNDGGTLKLGLHDSADDPAAAIVATEQTERNVGIDSAYAAGDTMQAKHLQPGATAYMFVGSGANIVPGALLQSAGNGKLKAVATGFARFVALESTGGAVVADTRLRVEVIA